MMERGFTMSKAQAKETTWQPTKTEPRWNTDWFRMDEQAMSKLSAHDRKIARDRALWPHERALLSLPEQASRYRDGLTMHFRQFVALLHPWAITEHRNQVHWAKKFAAMVFGLLQARKSFNPPVVDETENGVETPNVKLSGSPDSSASPVPTPC